MQSQPERGQHQLTTPSPLSMVVLVATDPAVPVSICMAFPAVSRVAAPPGKGPQSIISAHDSSHTSSMELATPKRESSCEDVCIAVWFQDPGSQEQHHLSAADAKQGWPPTALLPDAFHLPTGTSCVPIEKQGLADQRPWLSCLWTDQPCPLSQDPTPCPASPKGLFLNTAARSFCC